MLLSMDTPLIRALGPCSSCVRGFRDELHEYQPYPVQVPGCSTCKGTGVVADDSPTTHWMTGRGEVIGLTAMSDDHVQNTHRLLREHWNVHAGIEFFAVELQRRGLNPEPVRPFGVPMGKGTRVNVPALFATLRRLFIHASEGERHELRQQLASALRDSDPVLADEIEFRP